MRMLEAFVDVRRRQGFFEQVLKGVMLGDCEVFGAKLGIRFGLGLRWSSLCGGTRGDGEAGVS